MTVDRVAIRRLAAEHIRELGLGAPPFDHDASLRARGLELLDEPLEAFLAGSPLPTEEQAKIDGVIDLEERVVCLKAGLHPHQYRFALRHEVGHDVIPWQRELLYYCPLFSLSPELQQDFEREATVFAAECAFFADRFDECISGYQDDLRSAVSLADEHVMSYDATARHYVECHPKPCVLVVSKPAARQQDATNAFETSQYIQSPTANRAVAPRQRFDATEILEQCMSRHETPVVVDHEATLRGPGGPRTYRCQSFSNGYKLFTLVWL